MTLSKIKYLLRLKGVDEDKIEWAANQLDKCAEKLCIAYSSRFNYSGAVYAILEAMK